MDSIFPGMANSPNVHPLFVHFPVALWLVAAGAWVLWLFRPSDSLWSFGRWALRIGLVGAAAAICSGYAATNAMGHDSPGHGLVHGHRDWMLWTSGFALLTAIVDHAFRRRVDVLARGLLVGMGVITAGLLSVGADRGGELVFRYSIGTAGEALPATDGHDHHHTPAPAPVASEAASEPEAHDHPPKAPEAAPVPEAPPPGHEGHDHAH
jgi:uncharacterized membrane protein